MNYKVLELSVLSKCYSGDLIKNSETYEACDTCGRQGSCIQGSDGES